MTPRKKKPGTAPPPTGESGFSLIPRQRLMAIYAAMLKCRLLEQRMRAERLASLPRMHGREAVAAGVATQLREGDRVLSIDAVPLAEFVHKDSVRIVLPGFGARERAPQDAHWETVLKRARRLNRGKKEAAAAVFCGSVIVPVEILRSAAAEKLPILFVCHHQRTGRNLAAAADRCRLPGIAVDCEDAVAIYRVASEALTHARRGNGPTLIECIRWKVEGAAKAKRSGSALQTMESYLASKSLSWTEFKHETTEKFARELDKAIASTKKNKR